LFMRILWMDRFLKDAALLRAAYRQRGTYLNG
jgi:hypothetical protein